MPAAGTIVQWTVQHPNGVTTGEKRPALVVRDGGTVSDVVIFYPPTADQPCILKEKVPNAQLT